MLAEQRVLLGPDAGARDQYLREWEAAARSAYLRAFRIIKAAERQCFQEKSYFNRRDAGLLDTPLPADDPKAH